LISTCGGLSLPAFACRSGVAVPSGVGDAFIESSEISAAFDDVVPIFPAPDPAIVVTL
jgi:hypothetical protein